MFTPVQTRASSAYRRVSADTSVVAADAHQLVTLLFQELMQSIANARGSMERKQIPEKCASISQAIRILDEGLRGSLNLAQGGEIAENLDALYNYCILQLTKANAFNDDAMLREVRDLIEPVALAWKEIRAEVSPQPAGAAARG